MRCIATTTPAAVEHFEALTNLFLDGVTRDDDDAELFSHLARCASCRCRLNVLVEFRRLVQGERFEIPPWTDSELFSRIDRQSVRPDLTRRRASTNRPLATTRSLATAGSLAAVVALLLVVAALLPKKDTLVGSVTASQEIVRFETIPISAAPVYVFYPGLVIEESR